MTRKAWSLVRPRCFRVLPQSTLNQKDWSILCMPQSLRRTERRGPGHEARARWAPLAEVASTQLICAPPPGVKRKFCKSEMTATEGVLRNPNSVVRELFWSVSGTSVARMPHGFIALLASRRAQFRPYPATIRPNIQIATRLKQTCCSSTCGIECRRRCQQPYASAKGDERRRDEDEHQRLHGDGVPHVG